MELTVTFTDYITTWEAPTRKNGRRKPTTTKVTVEDTLHPVTVSFNGEKKTYYTRGKEQGKTIRGCIIRMDHMLTESGSMEDMEVRHTRKV